MAKLTNTPTDATLMRFNINPNKVFEEYEIWTLDLPTVFRDALWQFKTDLESKLKNKVSEYIGIPNRQLNNALISIFPSVIHAFEYKKMDMNKKPIYTHCLAIGKPSAPFELPNPEDIRHVIREWAQLWTERKYIIDNIPVGELKTLRAKLIAAINMPIKNWDWKRISANQLLRSFNPSEPLNYTALPSLLAALLHGKASNIHGKQIQWRKVQDGESQTLSVVGFVNRRPISANYSISEYQMSKTGDGYFAYKFEFRLETQAGRGDPWMFVSLHAQRYAHEALTHPNDRRRVSILTAANRARLDDFHADTTLVKLRTSEVENNFEWNDDLSELLARIGAIPLKSPDDIFIAPQNSWQPPGLDPDFRNDEYYIVHAEGYGYGDSEDGHQLEAGFSMTDSAEVYEKVISEHLPMLQLDVPLTSDDTPTPSGKKKPFALNDYTVWTKEPPMKPTSWGVPERREEERYQRYVQQRSKYQQIAKEVVARALRGGNVLIIVLWHNQDTRDGICKALEEAFLLNPGDSYPSNVIVDDRFVSQSLLESLDTMGTTYEKAHHQLMLKWRDFLQQQLPPHPNRLAIIETFGKKKGWGVKGAAREACVREGITSQMVETIHMKLDKSGHQVYLGGRGNHEHRANSVAHEVTLRHIGALYGNPQEIYQAAGIKEEKLEVLAFFLKQTQTNIKYPVAVKLAYDGAVEVRLPDRNNWLLYKDAAPALGQILAGEWHNTVYKGNNKRKIKDDKKNESALWYDKIQLNEFVLSTLKNLEKPTIALIEAENWRNFDLWPQLSNPKLSRNWNVLDFSPHNRTFERSDPLFSNLLAIIRIRTDRETPQYLTNTRQEFTQLTGFIDANTGDLMHYFSIGRQLVTGRGQRFPSTRHATMFDGVGAGVAYKYPQVVEFVPFFVREDYSDLESLKKLCRPPHYLRISPAWPQGNIVLPYPMHLAQQLVDDQLCILAMDV